MIAFHVDWYCPSCGLTDQTPPMPERMGFNVVAHMHPCARMGGLATPMLRKGVAGKIEARLREDYVGQEDVRLDDAGRPVMSLQITRDDGQDAVVYAPTAKVGVDSGLEQ